MSRAQELLEEENAALRAQLRQIRMEVAQMVSFVHRDLEHEVKKGYGYSPGDEKAPFFSESFLYPLFGKDAARTVLAYVDGVRRVVDLNAGEAATLAHLSEVIDHMGATYYLDCVREALGELPPRPEYDGPYPAGYFIKRSLRTKAQQVELDKFYAEDKAYTAYQKKLSLYNADPKAKALVALAKCFEIERNLTDAKKAVRDAESSAHVREFFRGRDEE